MLMNIYKLISILLIIQLVSILKSPIIFSQQLHKAEVLNSSQREEVKNLIKSFIRNNPELIVESVQKMREKSQNQISNSNKKNIKKYKKLIFYDPQTPIIGNPNGDITIVEFFDYNCGYCKSSLKVIKKLGHQTMVWGFINLKNKKFKEGDLLKASGWRAPALNKSRGNIFDNNYVINWTGPKYLSGYCAGGERNGGLL